jgi:hypothetical protein
MKPASQIVLVTTAEGRGGPRRDLLWQWPACDLLQFRGLEVPLWAGQIECPCAGTWQYAGDL